MHVEIVPPAPHLGSLLWLSLFQMVMGVESALGSNKRACLQTPQLQSNIFASLDETLLARAEALAAVDIAVSQGKTIPFKPDASYHTMSTVPCSSNSPVPLSHHHHNPTTTTRTSSPRTSWTISSRLLYP
ncbi:hypothetical protein AGOR_G00078210 [Albula goreensis]|uniref:Uncharacterized protein n=1 Tax=Albula goreensis TaxID=1534307 RepID=A0A8T3DT77_9TELE|nr:hypothetical protein AGOR_G00078210 [Albula goreensis]